MSRVQFDTFFQSATGGLPYDYQSRLADSDSGTACDDQVIKTSTGSPETSPRLARLEVKGQRRF